MREENRLSQGSFQVEFGSHSEKIIPICTLLRQQNGDINQPLETRPHMPGSIATEQERQSIFIQLSEGRAHPLSFFAMLPKFRNMLWRPQVKAPVQFHS